MKTITLKESEFKEIVDIMGQVLLFDSRKHIDVNGQDNFRESMIELYAVYKSLKEHNGKKTGEI